MDMEVIKDYYGKTLTSSDDLKTSACCTPEDAPLWLRRLLGNVHYEVLAKYYGCGLVAPSLLEGARILDLGSGFDVIVSNCVLNLARDKLRVLRDDPVLLGECLGGALYWNDFQQMAKRAGFLDPRLVADRPLGISDETIAVQLGAARFFSATYRLFKLPTLEPFCEDYGQAVIYRGGVAHHDDVFALDKHHVIERGKVFPVCGNTWMLLQQSRFAPHFDFIGDFSRHFGIFAGCGTNLPFGQTQGDQSTAGACC